MKQPETVFKELVLSDLKKLPKTYVVKIQQVVIRGTLDLHICCNGHFAALELKRDHKQKADPLQDYTIKKILEAGGSALVVHPLNWPDVLCQLSKLAQFTKPALTLEAF